MAAPVWAFCECTTCSCFAFDPGSVGPTIMAAQHEHGGAFQVELHAVYFDVQLAQMYL